MTTDERINRLVERHEALAESVESLKATTEEMQTMMGQTDRRIRDTQQIIVGVARDLQNFSAEIRDSMLGLVAVIRNHEQRIYALEPKE